MATLNILIGATTIESGTRMDHRVLEVGLSYGILSSNPIPIPIPPIPFQVPVSASLWESRYSELSNRLETIEGRLFTLITGILFSPSIPVRISSTSTHFLATKEIELKLLNFKMSQYYQTTYALVSESEVRWASIGLAGGLCNSRQESGLSMAQLGTGMR